MVRRLVSELEEQSISLELEEQASDIEALQASEIPSLQEFVHSSPQPSAQPSMELSIIEEQQFAEFWVK